MLDLALSVLFSSLIFVIFKLFKVYKIETLYAIITNYVVACVVGLLFYNGELSVVEVLGKPWFPGTLLLGFLFIAVFNLMAATAQKVGVSVASVATKMSLVIPVLFGVLVYKEALGPWKIVGVLLALAAVYFASVKPRPVDFKNTSLFLPLLVFLGSGLIDTSIKYVQEVYIEEREFSLFSATVFASAALMGILFVLLRSYRTPIRMNLRNALGGVALGVPNYFSIYFLLRALQNQELNSASVFTINNVAIVMFSTLLGILLFKEHLSVKNWSGIALAIVSIVLVALF
ncbi:DMT family transporter [Flavobacteriaceae bacterium TP-CH-4]|uniref:DMT family transporter n=1 Tax=Pelagihabitans pacificus TaxID=2696054 RepID=A0A967AUA5_9FLAO|nr:DMT family transporter [Pelagihabitans pacificus]NHF59320.1 DMT family transporter [Pelagihabitans pacificus]